MEIDVQATQTNIHPKTFKTIKIIFKFVAKEGNRKVIERAIRLSEKQFCGVTAMLNKTADISWTLKIVDFF